MDPGTVQPELQVSVYILLCIYIYAVDLPSEEASVSYPESIL